MTEILIYIGVYSIGIITGVCIVFSIAVKEEAKARNIPETLLKKN